MPQVRKGLARVQLVTGSGSGRRLGRDWCYEVCLGCAIEFKVRYADDIILLATSEAELQELVYRLDRVSRKYSLLINVDKTKVMASDGIACRILIQNELLEQVDTFPYHGSLITEDGNCTTEFRTRLNRGQAIEASLQKIWKSHKKRDNARNNARCTKARKATHGLDGQHQDVDRIFRGRVNQNDRGQG